MEPTSALRHTKHIFRVAFLFGFVLLVLILSRGLFVPKSWGQFGWYRGDAVAEHREKPVIHQGDFACGECHEEQYDLHEAGSHITVGCEVCHEPIGTHITNGEMTAPMSIPASFELCTRCHRRLAARPADFPQVNPKKHLGEAELELTDTVCTECHDPHSPI